MRNASLLLLILWLLFVQVLNGQTYKNDSFKKSYSHNKAEKVKRENYRATQNENASVLKQPYSTVSEKSAMDCPTNSLYSNPAAARAAYCSESATGYSVATSYYFDGIIDTVIFWGINHFWDEHWITCSNEDPMIFDVTFYEKNGNNVGAEYITYFDVEAVSLATGVMFSAPTEVYQFKIALNTPCNLSNGFVSFTAKSDNSCWFMWVGSPEGSGSAFQYSDIDGLWTPTEFPFSLCLIGKPNSCLAPVDLSVSNLTVSGADLAWNELNSASNWQLEFTHLGTNQVTSTIIDTDLNPYAMDGLTAQSFYEFSAKAICSEGDTSQWSVPLKFKTECDVITSFPLTETFDGDWNIWCWKIVGNTMIGKWIQSNAFNNAHWLSGNYVAYGKGENRGYLISPPLALDGVYQLSWWSKAERGEFHCDYEILVSTTGINPSDFTHNLGTFHCATDNWTKQTLFLDAFQGQTIYVAIHQTSNAWWDDFGNLYGLCIEDVTIDLKPDCIPVTDLGTINTTDTSIQLCWVENGDANAWNIEYGKYGFKLGDGTQIHVTENPFLLTGLSPESHYEFYIEPDCGNGTSEWAGPYPFETLCGIATDISESFEQQVPPACWITFADGYGAGAWNQCDWMANQGSYSATVASYYDKDRGQGWLITPKTTIPMEKALSFFLAVQESNSSSSFSVKISTAESRTLIDLLTIQDIDLNPGVFTQYTIDLSAYEGQDVYLAFVMLDSYVNRWFLDDVTFISCHAPSNIALKNVSTSSADISWESNAAEFTVQYGDYGFVLGQGIFDRVSTPTYSIASLEPSHNYDFYVKAHCTDQDSSPWTGPFTFTTSNLPCEDIVEFPYFEGFEGQNEFTCWTPMYNTANDGGLDGSNLVPSPSENSWVIITPESLYNGGASYIFEGIRAAYIDKYAPNFNWLISPNIVMPNGGGNLNLRIWYNNYVWASQITKFYVAIFNGNIWTTALTCDENTPINLYSELVEVNLSEYSNQTIKIAFVYEQNNGYEMAIDNITINGYTILNTETEILTYNIAGETEAATINLANHTIDVLVAGGTDLNALVASFTLSEGATVKVNDIVQVSGQTVNNFNNHPVIYQVIAEDGVNLQNWTVTVTPNSIGDNWVNTVKIYPNPTNDKFMVEGAFSENAIMKILDITGKLVTTVEIKSNKQIIDLVAFENGIYFIEIATKNQKTMFKIFKQ